MATTVTSGKGNDGSGLVAGPSRAASLLLPALAFLSVTVFDPVGWDHFGPVRWMIIPALGFAFIASSIEMTRFSPPNKLSVSHLWAGLLAWGLIATVAAIDPLHGWIGTPDRRFGWPIWLLCGGLFLVCRGGNAATTQTSTDAVTKAVAAGGVGLGLYTVAELADRAIDVSFAGDRAGGPFGQPAYLGAVAVLVIPIAVGLAVENRANDQPNNQTDPQVNKVWQVVGWVGAVGGGLALLASQSRAAWLGALAAAVIWLAIYLSGVNHLSAANRSGRLTSMAAIVAPLLLIVATPALRARLTSSFGQNGVVQGRLDEWQVGLRALADAPFFGYGPEGYRAVFGRHVDEQYVIDWGREVVTDRAHAGLLDVGLIFGIPGALLYLGLMLMVGAAAVRSIRSGRPLQIGLGVAALAYVIQQQFFFPLSEVDPLFWIIAGLSFAGTNGETSSDALTRPVLRQLGRGLATGLAVVALLAGLADMVANVAVRQALDNPATVNDPATLDDPATVETATSWRPDSIRYRFIASRLAGQAGGLNLALQQIERGLQRSSVDPALRGERGRLILERARATTSGSERNAALAEATAALQELVDEDPNNPEHRQRLGIALALSGNFDAAEANMERAIILAPEQSEPVQNLREIERLQESE
ncbi:MAG: O-antigen ligase family protein [Acidimicrobiales bacterium]